MSVYLKDPKANQQGKPENESLNLFIIGFTNSRDYGRFLFSGFSLSRCRNLAMKRFDTFMNCYRDDSRQYVSSITQFSVLFPLKLYIFVTIFDLVNWNLLILLD